MLGREGRTTKQMKVYIITNNEGVSIYTYTTNHTYSAIMKY